MYNFGKINETFKNILADSITAKDSKGKQIFKKYVKALKESSALTIQYKVYNNIENKEESNSEKSSLYVDESISLLKELGKNKIISENNKLVKFLTKNGYSISDDDYSNKELHENIHNLAINKKTTKNLDNLIESRFFINDYIKGNVKTVISENEDSEYFHTKTVGAMMVEKFNDKYDDKLNESEKLVFNAVTKGTEVKRKELFITSITECIDLVNQHLTECSIDEKDKLLQVKDRLLRLSFTDDNFVSEMTKIIDLKNNLI